jgi:hypothetical protein
MVRVLSTPPRFVNKAAPLLCRVWGHAIDEDASYYYGVDYCDRCVGAIDNKGPREWIRTRFWIIRRSIYEALIRHVIGFFSRCPDCNHRFNRCDESVDHLPF